MFKLENFLLTQDLPLIPSGKKEMKQNNVWEKWETYIFKIGNFLSKYFFEKKKFKEKQMVTSRPTSYTL